MSARLSTDARPGWPLLIASGLLAWLCYTRVEWQWLGALHIRMQSGSVAPEVRPSPAAAALAAPASDVAAPRKPEQVRPSPAAAALAAPASDVAAPRKPEQVRPSPAAAALAAPASDVAAPRKPEQVMHLYRWSGRTGNNIIQLVKALVASHNAAAAGAGPVELRLPEKGRKDGIASLFTIPKRLIIEADPALGDASCNVDEKGTYFFTGCTRLTKQVVRHILQKYVRPLLLPAVQQECEGEGFKGLTLHLRAGRLLQNRNHEQARFLPCKLFELIIREHAFKSVLIVTEPERDHPCIEALASRCPDVEFTIQSKGLVEDACALMTARNAATGSWSTFSQALLLMNSNLEVLFEGRAACSCEAPGEPDRRLLHCYSVPSLAGPQALRSKVEYMLKTPASAIQSNSTCSEASDIAFRPFHDGS